MKIKLGSGIGLAALSLLGTIATTSRAWAMGCQAVYTTAVSSWPTSSLYSAIGLCAPTHGQSGTQHCSCVEGQSDFGGTQRKAVQITCVNQEAVVNRQLAILASNVSDISIKSCTKVH